MALAVPSPATPPAIPAARVASALMVCFSLSLSAATSFRTSPAQYHPPAPRPLLQPHPPARLSPASRPAPHSPPRGRRLFHRIVQPGTVADNLRHVRCRRSGQRGGHVAARQTLSGSGSRPDGALHVAARAVLFNCRASGRSAIS